MKHLKVAYIIPAFSTWVMEEILEIRRNGIDIELFCLPDRSIPSEEIICRVLSEEARKTAESACYLPTSFLPYFLTHLLFLIISPRKYCYLWMLLLKRVIKQLTFRNNRKQVISFRIFFKVSYLAKIFRSSGILHIHSHFATLPTFAAMLVSKLIGVSFSFTTHDEIFLAHWDLTEEIKHCTFIIATSYYSKNYLISTYGKELNAKVKVIYLGVDIEKFHCRKMEKSQRQIISSVGFLVCKKGFSYLIEACKILRKRGYTFQTIIAGDGPERRSLEKLITEYDLENNISLYGMISQEELPHFLKKTMLFVLPSIVEKDGNRDVIPVASMEAMAMGIPVISTEVAGIPELIEHMKTGLLIPQRNSEKLAEGIEILLNSKELRYKLGKSGQEKILKDFSLQKNGKEKYLLFKSHVSSELEGKSHD